MTTSRKYAAFILSHGRHDRVYTYSLLRSVGYTGPIYIVCDDEDETLDQYKKEFGDQNVLVFSKEEQIKKEQARWNFLWAPVRRNIVLYARNACYDLADRLGLTHFIELDDDYYCLDVFWTGKRLVKNKEMRPRFNVNEIFDHYFDLLDSSPLIGSVAFLQSGDFLIADNIKTFATFENRKAMNFFFFDVSKRVDFLGFINEDVNAYVYHGHTGRWLLFSPPYFYIRQKQTQTNEKGLTDLYKEFGTYVKSFLSVMYCPSCVKVGTMGFSDYRFHHVVNHNATYPKLLKGDVCLDKKYLR